MRGRKNTLVNKVSEFTFSELGRKILKAYKLPTKINTIKNKATYVLEKCVGISTKVSTLRSMHKGRQIAAV